MKTKDPTSIADEIRWEPISRRQFLRLTGITAAGFLAGHCSSKETQLEPGTPLAIVNGTLIDGNGVKAIPDAVIIVRKRIRIRFLRADQAKRIRIRFLRADQAKNQG